MLFILLGQEPPEDRKDLAEYINKIDIQDMKGIIKELIKEDYRQRPLSGNKLYSSILEQKAKMVISSNKIPFRCTFSSMHKLYRMGVISKPNQQQIEAFIPIDTKEYYGYKIKNKFYFIGDRIRYQCKYDNYQFVIVDINIIENQIDYESEMTKGIFLFIPWLIVKDGQKNYENYIDDIEKLVHLLADHEIQKRVSYNKKALENVLINNWKILLQEEFNLLKEKKGIGDYTSYKLDYNGDKIYVTVNNLKIEIDNDAIITMTEKVNREQKNVGLFKKIIDENTILVHLDSEVDLDEISQHGTLGINTLQEYSNLKRYSYALDQVQKQNTINPNILTIINDPTTVQMNRTVPIDSFQQSLFKDINSPNALAVKKALATKDIFLLQGPPGTGKTTVITEIICQILNREPDAKILLTSQSHVAVDHAIGKVSKLLPQKCIIRIGRSNRISEESNKLLYSNKLDEWVNKTKNISTNNLHKYLNNHSMNISLEAVQEELNFFNFDIPKGVSSVNNLDNENKRIIQLIAQWQKSLGKLDDFDEIFAEKASIVAATCLGIASRSKLSSLTYDWVIIDEAARATPLETLVPLIKGKRTILVGDHKQLPPVIKTSINLTEKGIRKSDLQISLFEELIGNVPLEAKSVLTEQFRMHPVISELIATVFYPDEGLITNLKPEDRKHHLKWEDKSIVWLDTGRMTSHQENNIVFSKSNYAEVKIISHILEEIQDSYKKLEKTITIGVISGYDAQKNALIDAVNPKDVDKWSNIKINIDNVDAFQGSEVDVVIYSIVRSNNVGELGFLKDTRRLNVALSRGRCGLIIVGDYNFVINANTKSYNPFNSIAKYMQSQSANVLKEVQLDE